MYGPVEWDFDSDACVSANQMGKMLGIMSGARNFLCFVGLFDINLEKSIGGDTCQLSRRAYEFK